MTAAITDRLERAARALAPHLFAEGEMEAVS